MVKGGIEVVGQMRMRVAKDLTTIFASYYKAKVSSERMLEKDALADYNIRRTNEKYLVIPNG